MASAKPRSKSLSKYSNRLGKDDNAPPWPEWSDNFVKTTVWNPKIAPVPQKGGKSAKSNKATPLSRSSIKKSVTGLDGELSDKCYSDGWSRRYNTFAGEEVSTWQRAGNVDGLKQILVYNFKFKELDLLSSNSHLMDNKAMKEIVECVSCLNMSSLVSPFSAEFATANFIPLVESWRPWHHVYSLNSPAAGDGHAPLYNDYGRYIVRLYFFGKWRRIEVDDYLPLDTEGKLLVPVACNNDLWLAILAKALLRVITVYEEDTNITVITALTGWIKNSVSFRGASVNDVWNLCCSYLLKKNDSVDEVIDDIHCSYFGGSCLNDTRHLFESKYQTVFIFARIIEPIYNFEDVEPEKRTLFTYVYQVTQNWIKVEEYPTWKEYRWFDWAYKHNILKGKIGDIFKYIEVFSPFWDTDTKNKENAVGSVEPSDQEPQDNSNPNPNPFREWQFDMFRECVEELEIYFLPSQFENFYRSESLNVLELSSKPKGKSGDQGKGKSADLASSRFYEQGCRSFYIIVDSPYCKKIYVDMMFLANSNDSPSGHVTCEKFYWNQDTQATPVFVLKTRGCTNSVIRVGPGRHAFRVWCEMPQSYFVQIFSNTSFVLENLETLQEIFVQESVSYKLFGDQITESFQELVRAEYGSEEHSRALKKYTECFYPTDLRQKSQLHENLMYKIPFDKVLDDAITRFIVGTDLMKSITNAGNFIIKLRKLLLNTSFGEEILMEFEHIMPPDAFDDAISSISFMTTSPDTSPPKTKDKKPVVSASELFFDKSDNNVKLLKIIMSKESSFLPLYPFCFDDRSKIMFHDYKGKLELQTYHPFFIAARLVLNVHSLDLTSCGVYSFLHHDFCRICIYDIATMNLLPVKLDRNSVWKLHRSYMGFVILLLCFNLSPQTKSKSTELHWKLRVASCDENSLLHPCRLGSAHQHCNFKSSTPPNTTETIRGYYIPNASNLVTKFLITLNQNDVVTLQLTVSCPSAVIRVIIKGSNDLSVKESEGKGNVLMPSVVLNLKDSSLNSGYNYFLGEVHLIRNSWPLSNEEDYFVNQIKDTYVPFSDIIGTAKSRKKKSKVSLITTLSFEESTAPMWTLTMITETGHRDKSVKLTADTRIYDSFKTTYTQLGVEERLTNGLELRAQFNNYVKEISREEKQPYKSFDKISDYFAFYQAELNKHI